MVGFSAFVSVGSMLDVGWGDLIDYLGDDPRTRSIVIYMESIGDARAFPLGGARSGAQQAHHRDQSRAAPRRPPKLRRRTPVRSDRQRRSSGSGVPPLRRAAGQHHRRSVLHGGVLAKQPRPKVPV